MHLLGVTFQSYLILSRGSRLGRHLSAYYVLSSSSPEIALFAPGEAKPGAKNCLTLKGSTPHVGKVITTLVDRAWTSAIISYNYSQPVKGSVCL